MKAMNPSRKGHHMEHTEYRIELFLVAWRYKLKITAKGEEKVTKPTSSWGQVERLAFSTQNPFNTYLWRKIPCHSSKIGVKGVL